jgi:DNA (cytosine-5)-methyltransferase 1
MADHTTETAHIKPRLLDLFCCAGGAGAGYAQAGFEVVGIDIDPQPRYPFKFIQADALDYLFKHGQEFDAIHASPPCQAFSAMKHMPDAKEHPELVAPVRGLLQGLDVPWVIENVPGAPLLDPVLLCGTMFGLEAEGFQLRRHRLFESNVALAVPQPCQHDKPTIGVYGGHVRCRSSKFWRNSGADFPGYDKKALAATVMGADWMTMNELSEAIPPAYTLHLGRQIIAAVERRVAA